MSEPPNCNFSILPWMTESLCQAFNEIDRIPGRSITCPRCGKTSYNHGDIKRRYCGNCHQFHDTRPK